MFSEYDITALQNEACTKSFTVKMGKWLQMFYKLITILALNVLLALLLYSTEKRCEIRHSAGSCDEKGDIQSLANLCKWDSGKHRCEAAQSNTFFLAVVYVVLLVSVLTSLLGKATRFLFTHATLAIKKRRMHWLYSCCVSRAEVVPMVPVTRFGAVTAVKVAPLNNSINNNLQQGSITSGLNASSYMSHSTAKTGSSSMSNNNNILGVTQNQSKKLTKNKNNSSNEVELNTLLLEQEDSAGLEQFGDEWKAQHVQSRKST